MTIVECRQLTPKQRTRKRQLEEQVRRGLPVMLSTMKALATLRDEELWREDADSFDEYVRATFPELAGLSLRRINQRAAAGHVAKVLEAAGMAPTNEAQLRDLTDDDLPEEALPIIWQIKNEQWISTKEAKDAYRQMSPATQTNRAEEEAEKLGEKAKKRAELKRILKLIEKLGQALRCCGLRSSAEKIVDRVYQTAYFHGIAA